MADDLIRFDIQIEGDSVPSLAIDQEPDGGWVRYNDAATRIRQQAARIEELETVLGPLLTSAKMLQQNAEGCAVNHYGADFCTHGMPGWLLDTQQTIEDAAVLKQDATNDT